MNMPTTQQTGYLVRRATRHDLAFVAWCNYEASSPYPGFCYWDPLLDGLHTPTMRFIEAMFQADALAYGRVEDFFIIEQATELLGGASGFVMSATDYRPLHLPRMKAVAELLAWTPSILTTFLERYEQVWQDPQDVTLAPTASWTIECVAVKAAVRGRGIGKQLLEAVIAAGQAQGHTHTGIAVTIGNEAAQKLYEAVGFAMVVTYGAAYFNGAFPGTIKYRR
jgi:ribosomal protein S18 acetylase RimI-like enzyme